MVYAQSGAGKTSILNAQVTTELEKNGFEVLPLTRVGFSPTASQDYDDDNALKVSNVYMFNALCSMKPDIDPKLLSNKSLVTFLNDYFPPKSSAADKSLPQVIIFDQLEELFNLFPEGWHEQQENFFKQVAEALDKKPLLRIVFVIREDYLGELDPFAWVLPEKLRPRFRLERLRKAGSLSAIKGPLENRQFHFDEYQVEKIVEDLLKIRVETIHWQNS